MRPLGILGWALTLVGVAVLALGGISYTKERETARVGPIEVAAERKGFIPPLAGAAAAAIGIALVVADRRRRNAGR